MRRSPAREIRCSSRELRKWALPYEREQTGKRRDDCEWSECTPRAVVFGEPAVFWFGPSVPLGPLVWCVQVFSPFGKRILKSGIVCLVLGA